MSPVLVRVFFSFLLSQLVMLHSAEKEKEIFRKCPPFDCGALNHIEFPFIPYHNSTNSACGFIPVDCSRQRIKLEGSGNWYKIFSISQDNTIVIQDEELQRKLDKRSCDINTISFPKSPYVSFNIMSQYNTTFYKCMIDDRPCSSYKNCTHCKIDDHKQLSDHHPIGRPNCSVINLPTSPTERTGDLFKLLNAKFSVQVNVSHGCLDCHYRGSGRCQKDSKGNFHCATLKGKNKKAVTLSAAIPSSMLVLGVVFLLIFITYQRQKRQKYESTNFLSRNSDLERDSVYFGIPIFSYNDLVIATNNFDSSKELGDGGFGTVYYGKLRDGREVAVKRLYEKNYRRVEQFMNEIEILTRVRYRNLVSLYGCTSRTSRELILVYEFVANGTVADHIHGDRANPSALTWPLRMNIAIETANALVYLHASEIIHRDVKTNNILLDDNFHVKVADFGLSRLFPTDVTHVSTAPQGTPGYVDPEYHQCYQLTNKSDVYSFGVVLIELISSLPAIDISRHRHEINLSNYAINKIQNHAIDELIDPVLGFQMDFKVRRMTTLVAELAFRCLQSDKELRPLMDEVLKDLIRIESEEEYEVDTNEDELTGMRSSEYDEVVF